MQNLWMDFETRSCLNVKEVGNDRYAQDPTTEVLMCAYAFDDGEVKLWLPILGEAIPPVLAEAMKNPEVRKMAWNYNFERRIWAYVLGIATPQGEWFDPSILSGYMALPIGLDRASRALRIDEAAKKIVTKGDDRLTKIFCQLSKTKKTDLKKNPTLPTMYFKDWNTNPVEWEAFKKYCMNDVRAERAVWYALCQFKCEIPPHEIKAWLIDQRMNHAGVWIDLPFVKNAKNYAQVEVAGLMAEMKEKTGLENPNSGAQLGGWLHNRNYPFDSLDKEHIAEAVKEGSRFKITFDAMEILALKQKLGGSAYTKLETILDRVSHDGRLRDQFLYHGAHTGRWSGRGVQLQNLFKPDGRVSAVLDKVTRGIRENNLDIPAIISAYNAEIDTWNSAHPAEKPKDHLKPFSMMDAVAGTIRSSFAAPPGKKLLMCDLAQIESRVLAALAGCQTMIDAYAKGLDLYCDFMTWLLGRTITKKDKKERAQGKVVILGCGFGMGVDKFIEYAATTGVILSEKEAKEAVYGFREKYKEIPVFWKALDEGAKRAVKLGICVFIRDGLIIDGRDPNMLKIKLPSGRYLHYLNPKIGMENTEYGTRECLEYESWDAKGKSFKRLYGGLLTENVVQAVARDILVNGMVEAEKLGLLIVMTIHDELVCECDQSSPLTYKNLEKAMTTVPEWGEGIGFVLGAEGDENVYYKK